MRRWLRLTAGIALGFSAMAQADLFFEASRNFFEESMEVFCASANTRENDSTRRGRVSGTIASGPLRWRHLGSQ